MQTEGPNSAKKEAADGVKVKAEKCAEQEAELESSEKGRTEMHDLWLWVKKEIKEEIERDLGPSSFDQATLVREIGVKEEQHLDLAGYHSEGATGKRVPERGRKAANGQTPVEPEPKPVPKRRRLGPKSAKKEFADDVKVKREKNIESRQESRMDIDDLWLQIQKDQKEINEHSLNTASSRSSSSIRGYDIKLPERDSISHPQKAHQKVEHVEPSEETDKSDGHEDVASWRSSMATFTAQAAIWAKQCFAFRSTKTWSPTRPCCPANFFLSSANGTPSPPPADAPACVLRLTGHGLRCLHRFHEKHSLQTHRLSIESEAPDMPLQVSPPKPQLDSDLMMQDCKVGGRDCMKMWPWMRDLPTCMWAGRGWAFDENGLRQLPSTGGSNAMQGAEVFESVGAAAEDVKTTDQEIFKEMQVTEPAAPPGEWPKPSHFTRNNVAKQSGVPNIVWHNSMQSWQVAFPEYNSKGHKTRRAFRKFAVKKFMGPGCSAEKADALALQAAMTFRAELVKQGILSEAKSRDSNFTSEVPGVRWAKRQQKWHVEICPKGGNKKIQGGFFTDKAAAEAKALELREQHSLQRQVKPVDSLSTLPMFHPKVPYPGVTWRQSEQRWYADRRGQGARRTLRIKPKNHSEEELERSFKEAVAWMKKQQKEKEGGKTVKPKVKPGKKQPK